RHQAAHPREPQSRLRLPPTGVVASVAVDRLVFPEFRPVKVSGKIGTAFDTTERINVDRALAGAAGLGDLTPHITGDLLEVIIRVRDNAPRFLLEREQLAHHLLQLLRLLYI